ncbi:AAA family ATPase [Labrenzia sp. 011]|uniref:AAA family ATPase n=1 Tax=Labrenzia sp. 011 TaxID=2171494 RepID=UPI000D517BD2|nr:AAA family ATPase [Labrenzia sp. 011]PVB63638.1 transcriptional regulator [Labrenzia sp. 011]
MPKVELDIARGELVRDGVPVRLRPKTLAVLVELHERAGEVVSQSELRNAVWGQRYGRETGPKQCIRELRRLLGDSAETSEFIETVGRQGYRLAGRIRLLNSGLGEAPRGPLCVGRTTELERLAESAASARGGKRPVMLVAGETGAGKSTLVDAFVAALPRAAPTWSVQGQCIPHPGAREPYGPLVEVVAQLIQGPEEGLVRQVLADVAPSFGYLLPQPRPNKAPASLSADLAEATPDTMLREFTAFLEQFSQRHPGVIVLEDLHWADQSTLAWLLSWARRRGPGRVLVVGTYRFDEMDRSGDLEATLHYLKRTEGFSMMTLGGLDQPAVGEYLDRRFPGSRLPKGLDAELARRTEGHAILVDAVVEQWLSKGVVKQAGERWKFDGSVEELLSAITAGARDFIDGEIARLKPDERQILEAASVAGLRFSAAMLSDSRPELERIEMGLDRLAAVRRFIERAGTATWPDGTQATRYVFRHVLYQEALYDAIPAANRQGLHERVGSRLERAFGRQAVDLVPVMADHFERGADRRRAAIYRGLAGHSALKRGAVSDAKEQFRQALELHAGCPPDLELRSAECRTLLGLGAALIVGESFSAPELRDVCERAAALARQTDDATSIVPALAGLWNHHVSKANLAAANELSQGLNALGGKVPPLYELVTHNAVGQASFFSGDPAACLPHIEAVCDAYDAQQFAEASILFGEDPGIVCRQYAACVLQILDQDEMAEKHFSEGMQLAIAHEQPFGQAQMLWAGALIARERGEPERVLERAVALTEICETAAIPYWLPYGRMLAGWANVALGDPAGLRLLREGLDDYVAMDVKLTRPFGLALFAETAGRCGDPGEGLSALGAALHLTRQTGERWYEPEICRLWASLSLQTGRPKNAPLALRRAIALARKQKATIFERRALRDLERLNATSNS